MPSTFAVIDVGSNAVRLQIASVEQPGTYRIIEQDRVPVRLGHKVFETGVLDPQSRSEALEALRRFRNASNKNGVTGIRVVATSAMREARDGPGFVQEADQLGLALEILSGSEEARLICLAILSGLKSDPPLGLFVDIGGGSVELVAGNRSSTVAMFSLPLGAVRMTEEFMKHDPPLERELINLCSHVEQVLAPAVLRLSEEKYTMSFGSGGTLTSLADIDARRTGEPRHEPLYVLRRGRLKSLYEIFQTRNLEERADYTGSHSGRADILVAGSAVLLTIMNAFDLDRILVSRRGLRDGLMVDLLRSSYPAFTGSWTEEVDGAELI